MGGDWHGRVSGAGPGAGMPVEYDAATGRWSSGGRAMSPEEVAAVHPYLVADPTPAAPAVPAAPPRTKSGGRGIAVAMSVAGLAVVLLPVLLYLSACTGTLHPAAERDDAAALAAFASGNSTAAPTLDARITGYRRVGFWLTGAETEHEYNPQFYDMAVRERSSGLEATLTVHVPYGGPADVETLFPGLDAGGVAAACSAWKGLGGKGLPLVIPASSGYGPAPDPDLWELCTRGDIGDGVPAENAYARIRKGKAGVVGKGVEGQALLFDALAAYAKSHRNSQAGFPIDEWLASSQGLSDRFRHAWGLAAAAGLNPGITEGLCDWLVAERGEAVVSVGKASSGSIPVETDRGKWVIHYDSDSGGIPSYVTRGTAPDGKIVDRWAK